MSITQIKGNQILDGTITSVDIDDSLEKDFTKVRVTTGDSSPDFLSSKILAGDNMTINVIGASGSIQYLAISGSAGGSGTITGVTAGTGLIDGGTNGSVTLDIDDAIVATISGTTFIGVTKHNAGLSGSLTKLIDETSYLIAGQGIDITSASNGAVTVSTTAASTVAGSNTQIQFNDSGSFGASSNLLFNKSNNALTLSGSLFINTSSYNPYDYVIAAYQTVDGNKTVDFGYSGLQNNQILVTGSSISTSRLVINSEYRSNVTAGTAAQSYNGVIGFRTYGTHESEASTTSQGVTGLEAFAYVEKPETSSIAGNVNLQRGLNMQLGWGNARGLIYSGSITAVRGIQMTYLNPSSARTTSTLLGMRIGSTGGVFGGAGVTDVYGIDMRPLSGSGIKLGIRTYDPIVINADNINSSEKLRVGGSSYFEGASTFTGAVSAVGLTSTAGLTQSGGDVSLTGTTTSTYTVGSTSGTGTITIGRSTATNTISVGSGGNNVANQQSITIGAGAGLTAVSIGAQTGASTVTIDAGTGNINIGTSASARTTNIATGAAAQTVSIGSTTGVSSLTLNAGSSGVSIIGNVAVAQGKLFNLGRATVTQLTSLSTGVTINSASGVITTVTANVGANSSTTFTVTNSTVSANSIVVATLGDYSGTIGSNGHPYILVDSIASGSFNVKICNAHSSNALNGTLKIKFIVA